MVAIGQTVDMTPLIGIVKMAQKFPKGNFAFAANNDIYTALLKGIFNSMRKIGSC